MKLAAVYIRVSTEMQTEYSPESQLRLIKDYAHKNSYLIDEEFIYRDEGISGRTAEKRPAFQRMMGAAKQRKFEAILIYNTSRFARNHEESIVYRAKLKRDCNIELISITQPNVDPKTDLLMNAIYAVMDERYSLDLADNVMRGMTEKALRGEILFKPPYGYELLEKAKVPIIVPEEAEIVKLIFNKYLFESKGAYSIAVYLRENDIKFREGKPFQSKRVMYILKNPIYCGKVCWNRRTRSKSFKDKSEWITSDGSHEPIISVDMFEKVQNKLNSRSVTKYEKPSKYTHWLSSLLVCSSCHSKITPHYIQGRWLIFECRGRSLGVCNKFRSISGKIIIPAVLKSLEEAFGGADIIYEKLTNADTYSEIDILQKQLSKAENKLKRAKLAFQNEIDSLDEYRENKNIISKEIESLSNKMQTLEKATEGNNIENQLRGKIKSVYDIVIDESMPISEKSSALKSVVSKIEFDKDSNTIRVFYFYA